MKKFISVLLTLVLVFSSSITANANYNMGDLTIIENKNVINASSRNGNKIEYINIHYTGSIGDALQHSNYFKNGYRGRSAHYFVGYDGTIIQSVDDTLAAWSVGGSKYPNTSGGSVFFKDNNYNSINIEMCVKNNGTDYSASSTSWYFEYPTIYSTVRLVQELMKKYNIPIENVVRHYDVIGKTCPNPFVLNDDDITWDIFLAMVQSDPEELNKPKSNGITLNIPNMKYVIGNEKTITININDINKNEKVNEETEKKIEQERFKNYLDLFPNLSSPLPNINAYQEETEVEEGFTITTKAIQDSSGSVWIKVPENYISNIE